MNLAGNILITGGAGTLGRAIIRRAVADKWDCLFTIYSRDAEKHRKLISDYPGVHIRSVLGDLRDADRLTLAMMGHDTVIHAGANKHVGLCQRNPIEAVRANVIGSLNVAQSAVAAMVRHVVGISTDKACEPINVYGQTKSLMESIFLSIPDHHTHFSVARYGNVFGSTGSVIRVWENQLKQGKPLTITDPDATRFWLTEDQAVDLIIASIGHPQAITVPLAPSLDMGTFAAYALGDDVVLRRDATEITGLTPGEKKHEMLLTESESERVKDGGRDLGYCPVVVIPAIGAEHLYTHRDFFGLGGAYTSDVAPRLSRGEFKKLVGGER